MEPCADPRVWGWSRFQPSTLSFCEDGDWGSKGRAHTVRPLRTLARTSELRKPGGVATCVFPADGVLGTVQAGAGALAVEAGNEDQRLLPC